MHRRHSWITVYCKDLFDVLESVLQGAIIVQGFRCGIDVLSSIERSTFEPLYWSYELSSYYLHLTCRQQHWTPHNTHLSVVPF